MCEPTTSGKHVDAEHARRTCAHLGHHCQLSEVELLLVVWLWVERLKGLQVRKVRAGITSSIDADDLICVVPRIRVVKHWCRHTSVLPVGRHSRGCPNDF